MFTAFMRLPHYSPIRFDPTKMLYVNQDRDDKRIQDIIDTAEKRHIPLERLSSPKNESTLC